MNEIKKHRIKERIYTLTLMMQGGVAGWLIGNGSFILAIILFLSGILTLVYRWW